VLWLSGELPVLRHESGSETDVLRILDYLRKLVSKLLQTAREPIAEIL